MCQRQEKAASEFLARKTEQFMKFMDKMSLLDHNSLCSDRKRKIEIKTDRVMKEISIIASKHFRTSGDRDTRQFFNVSEKKSLLISNQLSTNMIRFKNKSEQKRFLRVAACIMALND